MIRISAIFELAGRDWSDVGKREPQTGIWKEVFQDAVVGAWRVL